jgi:CheY-like chemotaxis protein
MMAYKECWTYRFDGKNMATSCKGCLYHKKREEKRIPDEVRCWEYLSCKETCEIRKSIETVHNDEGTATLLGRGKKVLILDDSKTLRNLIKAILEEYEYEVDTVALGRDAIEKTNRWHPDIIICDINLAGSSLSGLDVLTQLKRFKKDSVVLMVSSKADPETIKYCMDNGAAAFVKKPFKNDELVEQVAKALAQKNKPQ